ncbi:MAG: hypothetical protein HY054_08545 [Proteobacteria bacterium]|nr:hypothetical protein [Pseudomonadota bacterium]
MRLNTFIAALLMLAASAPPALSQQTYAQTRAVSLYGQLSDASTCEAALPTARQFWPSTEFQQQLSSEDQSNFLAAVVGCAMSLQDAEAAIAAATAAHDLNATWADKVRLILGMSSDNDALTVQAFFDLAQTSPKDFAALESFNAWGAIRAAENISGGSDIALQMHNLLVSAHYTPNDASFDDFFRLDHARLLLLHNQVAQARARLDGVVDPQAILTIRINKIYDPLRSDSAFERHLDVESVANESIARARRAVADHPRQLSAVVGLARALRDVGRSREALDVIERVLPAARAEQAAQSFDDLEEQLQWLLNEKADLLYDLGRNDEARSIYLESVSANGGGGSNANQAVEFAGLLNAEGRATDALQVLQTLLPHLNSYGELLRQSERACAAEQLHDPATQNAALAILRAHEMDNPGALAHALLCMNDIDGAAALMIRRLANPVERERAILALQPFRHLETRHLPLEAVELQRLAQVRARPDVQAALSAVGRIEQSPLYGN